MARPPKRTSAPAPPGLCGAPHQADTVRSAAPCPRSTSWHQPDQPHPGRHVLQWGHLHHNGGKMAGQLRMIWPRPHKWLASSVTGGWFGCCWCWATAHPQSHPWAHGRRPPQGGQRSLYRGGRQRRARNPLGRPSMPGTARGSNPAAQRRPPPRHLPGSKRDSGPRFAQAMLASAAQSAMRVRSGPAHLARTEDACAARCRQRRRR
mmetsp:Transcript_86657/g.201637  ORF Transcript_86657/g.201637 Transcript_86657/m.201637 type:complete len:206 (+) Transcript_86657:1127-1744(+)